MCHKQIQILQITNTMQIQMQRMGFIETLNLNLTTLFEDNNDNFMCRWYHHKFTSKSYDTLTGNKFWNTRNLSEWFENCLKVVKFQKFW